MRRAVYIPANSSHLWRAGDKNVMTFKKTPVKTHKQYRYWYNGKEWQNDLDLNLYDYGARQYDPALGRWFTVDPMAEKFPQWSAYVYTYDNPIYFIDADGMIGTDWYEDEKGNIVYDENIKSQDDLDKAGIKGKYIGEEFVGKDQNGDYYKFEKDGEINKIDENEVEDNGKVLNVISKNLKEEKAQETLKKGFVATGVMIEEIPPSVVVAPYVLFGVFFVATCQKVFSEDKFMFSIDYGETGGAEHKKGARPSTKAKHQKGQARKARDRGGEKGDSRRRPPRKRPKNWKGKWPPKQ